MAPARRSDAVHTRKSIEGLNQEITSALEGVQILSPVSRLCSVIPRLIVLTVSVVLVGCLIELAVSVVLVGCLIALTVSLVLAVSAVSVNIY